MKTTISIVAQIGYRESSNNIVSLAITSKVYVLDSPTINHDSTLARTTSRDWDLYSRVAAYYLTMTFYNVDHIHE